MVKLTLRNRLLLLSFGIVVVLTALSLVVIHNSVERRIRVQLADDLDRTGSVFGALMRERADWLRSQSLVVAEDPRFSATLDIPDPDLETHARTVIPIAKQFQSIIGSDLFVTTNRSGQVLARVEITEVAAADVERTGSGESSEIWRIGSRNYDVVSQPVREGDDEIGSISVGFAEPVDALSVAEHLRSLAESSETRRALVNAGTGISGLLRELQLAFVPDVIAVSGQHERLAVIALCEVSSGADFSTRRPVEAALQAREVSGLYIEDERLYHLVAVPVWSQGQVIGSLSVGFQIDDRLAADLGRMMHSHVSFIHNGLVVASTWDRSQRVELQLQLEDRRFQTESHFQMQIGSETYLSSTAEFAPVSRSESEEDDPSDGGGFYLIQLSLDQALEFLSALERILLLIGFGVMAVAALVSFLGARRITRPVLALVDGTQRLAAGDLDHRLDVRTRSEIGQLARSFNDMAAALSESTQALEESEGAYRDLFDNAQDLVFTTDLQMRFTSVNKAGLQTLGYAADDVIGQSMYSFLSPADAGRVREQAELAKPGDRRPVVETSFIRADRSESTFELVSRWIVRAGETTGVHVIGRDVTERRDREQATMRFRERLHQAEKLRALGEMAAGVAHNFNNLLTVVLGNAELIGMHDDLPEPLQQDARRILESARRCSAIVRRIQTFGRPIDVEKTELVNLPDVVRDTVDLTKPKWQTSTERAGLSVGIEMDLEQVPPIESHGAAWVEILSNLIFNAVDAMPEGGLISVSTRRDGEYVVLSVSDNGVGMDEETRLRVFEPFFTTKDLEQGTGLGLSTIWGLVQTMGGRIEVDSSPGEGAKFDIRVPLASVREEAESVMANGGNGRALRILIVDDEPRVLELLPPLLQSHRVETANRSAEGLELVRKETYDVVVSDWVMAEVSGLEIAQEVRARSPRTVVVLMTGWEFKSTAADPESVVDLVLAKPFEREDVERVIDEAVQLWESRAPSPTLG